MTDDIIALIIKETGWNLEYIREQPVFQLYALVEEIQYLLAVEAYQRSYNSALVVCTLASHRGRKYRPEEIIGQRPERRVMAKKKLIKAPQIHKVTLLDEKEYTLSIMNLNVMADLEIEFEKGFQEISDLMGSMTMSSLRKILFVLLRKNYPDMTMETIGDLVDLRNMEYVAGIIGKVLSGE